MGFLPSNNDLMFHTVFLNKCYFVTVVFIILWFISWIVFFPGWKLSFKKLGLMKETLEMGTSVTPIFGLLILGIPAVFSIIMLDSSSGCEKNKVEGNQWFWSYFIESKNIEFDSYMAPLELLKMGEFRNLEVDNRLLVACKKVHLFEFSSNDVIHSWSVPSAGIKVDCLPDRSSMVNLEFFSPGLVYGQCAELCGANHSFMPICLEVLPSQHFYRWFG